jgi:hypothetical protein
MLNGQAAATAFVCVTLLLVAALGPKEARAFTLSTGEKMDCTIKTLNGPYKVPERWGFAQGFSGFTQIGQNGLPVITFDPRRMPRGGIEADFLFYHECAHARFWRISPALNDIELEANCEGLRKIRADGHISKDQEIRLGRFHAEQDVYGDLFGSGREYWRLTLRCAANKPRYRESRLGAPGPTSGALGSYYRKR